MHQHHFPVFFSIARLISPAFFFLKSLSAYMLNIMSKCPLTPQKHHRYQNQVFPQFQGNLVAQHTVNILTQKHQVILYYIKHNSKASKQYKRPERQEKNKWVKAKKKQRKLYKRRNKEAGMKKQDKQKTPHTLK